MSTIDIAAHNPSIESRSIVSTPPAGLDVSISPRWVARLCLVVIATLIVTGTSANIVTNQVAPSKEHKLAKLMNRFDLAFEPSIPNWYSSFSLLGCAFLLGGIAWAKARNRDRWFWHWLILAALFVGLSIDEDVRFHEMLHYAIASRIETHGLLYFPWVIPALIFVAVVGFSYVPFLLRLDRCTALLFVTAGATYVMGAVGMDMIGGVIVERHGMESVYHSIAQCLEELLEMLGILIFIYALLDYIGRQVGRIQLSVTP
jgi:hypothetical protein